MPRTLSRTNRRVLDIVHEQETTTLHQLFNDPIVQSSRTFELSRGKKERWADDEFFRRVLQQYLEDAKALKGHPQEKKLHFQETVRLANLTGKDLLFMENFAGGYAEVKGGMTQAYLNFIAQQGAGALEYFQDHHGEATEVLEALHMLKRQGMFKGGGWYRTGFDVGDADPYSPSKLCHMLDHDYFKLMNPDGFVFIFSVMMVSPRNADRAHSERLLKMSGSYIPDVAETLRMVEKFGKQAGFSIEHLSTMLMPNNKREPDARVSVIAKPL